MSYLLKTHRHSRRTSERYFPLISGPARSPPGQREEEDTEESRRDLPVKIQGGR